MKVPASFRMLGCTYTVHIIQAADWKEDECCGVFFAYRKELHILAGSEESMAHAFMHELMHAVMNAMGEDKLYHNEKFVDLSGGLIHQALTSATYGDD